MEGVPLIDISSEDDLLIPSSSLGLGSETVSNPEIENTERASKQMMQVSVFSESPQQKHRSDRYSLRKSLAWDSEFFTSEGVLNPEELAMINCAYSKAVGITLPGIHEELRKSAESTSTLDSENRALENLEVHLFENLRASFKKSLVDSNLTANKAQAVNTKEHWNPDIPRLRALKKLDISCKTKLKPPTTLKKYGTTRQHQGTTCNDGLVGAKLVAFGNGQTKRSIKPADISFITPLPPVHGKRSSVVNKETKSNTGKVLPGITAMRRQPGLALSKSNNDLGLDTSCSRTPKAAFKLSGPSCSSASRPASSSSDSIGSSSLGIMRNPCRKTVPSSSSLSSKTPAKTTRSRNGSTIEIYNSSLRNPASLLSMLSPTSSIDSFPSESSSQTSPSTAVVTENFASHKSGATSFGLRMPRPRIGYFDKENNLIQGSNKYMQTSSRGSLAKRTGISETDVENKTKHINLRSIRAETHQEVSPKAKKESTPKITERYCKKNFNTVSILEEMISSLSLSEVKNVI